jgi:hypothetical protein
MMLRCSVFVGADAWNRMSAERIRVIAFIAALMAITCG